MCFRPNAHILKGHSKKKFDLVKAMPCLEGVTDSFAYCIYVVMFCCILFAIYSVAIVNGLSIAVSLMCYYLGLMRETWIAPIAIGLRHVERLTQHTCIHVLLRKILRLTIRKWYELRSTALLRNKLRFKNIKIFLLYMVLLAFAFISISVCTSNCTGPYQIKHCSKLCF